jgi:carboxyl-terminal processing protease
LQSKDIIAAVDKQPTNGMSVDSVVKKIRGQENTKVTLTIVRAGSNPFDVTITRTKITVASVESHVDGNIGYIKINQFGADTAELAQKAAQDFKAQGVKAVVLDLRGDPGGYLDAAIDISSMWLDKGKTVVSERKGGVTENTDYAKGNPILKGIPTVVLIDGGSASASEITAGALRDNNAATLVGDKSFGKGSVQQVINLNGGGELKVTTAHWYTPAGKNINKQGISPDVAVQRTEADVKSGADPQKDKAYQLVQSKIQ